MAYIKIEDNIIVQKQPNEQDGFISVNFDVQCGMVHDGSKKFNEENFSIPIIPKSWDKVRAERNALLSSSDWTQIEDATADKAAWAAYRQELRDITDSFEETGDVVWPEKP